MTVKKLTDSDKQDILNLYRNTGETTSTLADRYGVSNSTISRFLKSTLQEDEYEALIGLKRAARHTGGDAQQTSLFSEPEPDVAVAKPKVEAQPSPETALATPAVPRLRKRSLGVSQPETTPTSAKVGAGFTSKSVGTQEIEINPDGKEGAEPSDRFLPRLQTNQASRAIEDSSSRMLDEQANAEASTIAQMLGEDLLDDSEEEDLDDDDLEDFDEDDLEEASFSIRKSITSETLVQVLPLSEASLPKSCYLVIDRASELITRPLKDFADLGQIPMQEVQQKTLPVFDNHRVARRFSTKRDKVIRVPDSRMLQKACSHLQAKGITRLLVDGQVYSLLPL